MTTNDAAPGRRAELSPGALRREVRRRDAQLQDEELHDWALMHALNRLDWYARHRTRTRVAYQALEVTTFVLAALTTVFAALQVRPVVTALSAAATTISQGVRRSFAWHEDWLAFSDAWADINRCVGQYRVLALDARTTELQQRLVAQVDEIVFAETRPWAHRRRGLRRDDVTGR
jgi:hypothetical protein